MTALIVLLSLQILLFLFALGPFIGGEIPLIGDVQYSFYNIFNKLGNFTYYTINLLFIVNLILIIAIMYRHSANMKSTFLSVILIASYVIIALGCFFVSFAYLDDDGNRIYQTKWAAYICGLIALICIGFSIYAFTICTYKDSVINGQQYRNQKNIKILNTEIENLKSKIELLEEKEEVNSNIPQTKN